MGGIVVKFNIGLKSIIFSITAFENLVTVRFSTGATHEERRILNLKTRQMKKKKKKTETEKITKKNNHRRAKKQALRILLVRSISIDTVANSLTLFILRF
ncbi:hypothetical protein K0M31_006574 [Melipona bicolor]|uniref:Uncharacterized protein n=1 Tax=Melipona bicolor TaxID=60889 RepID=A0AA40KKY9_9HYME|nr:hypothetical protein K0M31_006574 [Melipona bicolor]